MKEFNPDKVGKDILNEILSHGVSIEDIYKNFNETDPIEVVIQKEFQTSRSKFILTTVFSLIELHYLVATVSIVKRYEAIVDMENGSSMPVEDDTMCGIAGKITDGYISEAKIVERDDNPDFLYYDGLSDQTANIVKMVRTDSHEPRLFLEQVKLLLEDEIIYKDEVRVVRNSVRKAVRATIPIKRDTGIFS